MTSTTLHQNNMRGNILLGLAAFTLTAFLILFFVFEDSIAFQFIDESPFIIFIIGCAVFLVLWVIDTLSTLIKRKFQIDTKIHFQVIILFLGTLFAWVGIPLGKWDPMTAANFVAAFILLYGDYGVFQIARRRLFQRFVFSIREFYKAMALILLALVFLGLGKIIGGMLLSPNATLKSGIEPFVIFIFSVSFALGNLLNNLRIKFSVFKDNEERALQAEKTALDKSAQLQSLQSSINPHFLYNSLNSIASLATIDGEKTEKMAIALSGFYQYVTNKEESENSTMAEEIEMIQNFIEIEKIRHGDKLVVQVDIEEEALNKKLPHFLLQPIVENAIKYGYAENRIYIRISGRYEEGKVIIKIYDKGKPFSEQLESGYGLKSVMQKLALLYPKSHDIAFVNEPEKYVFISIDQNKNS